MNFITCFNRIGVSKTGLLDIGATRCFGYFKNKEEAFNAVLNNRCDINEFLYSYAVIEKIDEGIHSICDERWFFCFDYDKGVYREIDEPEEVKNTFNFAFG